MEGITMLSVLTATLLISLGMNFAYAETYIINIPTGAADPNASYFWQVESTGNTDGEITIEPLDTVSWENADTAAHTVTSGTAEAGPDGNFDSSLFPPGESFSYQFTEVGTFEYFCIVHPWMAGVVNVVEATIGGAQILHNVGTEVDEEGNGYDVEYILDRNLASATVDTTANTVTFILAGEIGNDELVIMLPEGLITNPNAVWVDDVQVTDFNSETTGDVTTLTIPLEVDSEEVVIRGTAVVPEFGSIAAIVLAVAVISAIAVTSKTQKFGNSKL